MDDAMKDVDEKSNLNNPSNSNEAYQLKTLIKPQTDANGLPIADKLPPIGAPPSYEPPAIDDEEGSPIIKMPQSSGINKPSQMGQRSGMAPAPGAGWQKGPGAILKNDNNNNNNGGGGSKDVQKYSDYIKQEKMRKFKRMPRLIGQRKSVKFTCPNPNCSKEGMTVTNYEVTGTQICASVTMCWCCFYAACCACLIPFCCCRMYNVRHSCPKCFY